MFRVHVHGGIRPLHFLSVLPLEVNREVLLFLNSDGRGTFRAVPPLLLLLCFEVSVFLVLIAHDDELKRLLEDGSVAFGLAAHAGVEVLRLDKQPELEVLRKGPFHDLSVW